MRRQQRRALRLRRLLVVLVRRVPELDVRAEAPGHQVHRLARHRVDAEAARAFGLGLQQFDRALHGQIGRRDVVGQRGRVARAALAALQERTEASDADANRLSRLRIDADLDRRVVDVAGPVDDLLEAHVLAVAAVEALDELEPALLAVGDLVEHFLHLRGEARIDVVGEVAPQQLGHGERREARHQRLALAEHVAAALDRAR